MDKDKDIYMVESSAQILYLKRAEFQFQRKEF